MTSDLQQSGRGVVAEARLEAGGSGDGVQPTLSRHFALKEEQGTGMVVGGVYSVRRVFLFLKDNNIACLHADGGNLVERVELILQEESVCGRSYIFEWAVLEPEWCGLVGGGQGTAHPSDERDRCRRCWIC